MMVITRVPVFLGPFFGPPRAASILPSRPQFSQPPARRACQGWPRLRGHPLGLGLDRPEHGGRLDWSGAGGCGHLDGHAANGGGLSEVATVSGFPTSIGLEGSGNGETIRPLSAGTDPPRKQPMVK